MYYSLPTFPSYSLCFLIFLLVHVWSHSSGPEQVVSTWSTTWPSTRRWGESILFGKSSWSL
jgi:hypothetical protein